MINKAEREQAEIFTGEFFPLGIKTMYAIAATMGRGVDAMLGSLLSAFPENDFDKAVKFASEIEKYNSDRKELDKQIRLLNIKTTPFVHLPTKSTHVIFEFTDGSRLFWGRIRMFLHVTPTYYRRELCTSQTLV